MDVTHAPPYPTLGRARYAQAVMFFLGTVTTMDSLVVALLIEPMKHDLGLSDVQVGLATYTSYALVYGLLSTPMGMMVDRVNRVRMLQVAILFWCGGLALGGLSHALWLLVLGKAITGVGAAISYPAAMSLCSDYFRPERRAFATMSYPIGQTMGNVAATLVGGLGFAALTHMVATDPQALHGVAPWRAISLIFAVAGLVLLPLLLMMREPARQEVGARAKGGTLRELWAYRRFLVPTLLAMPCLTGILSAFTIWTAPALTRIYGQQPGDFARWLSAVHFFAGLTALIVGPMLINMARRRQSGSTIMRPAMWCALLLAPCCCMAIMPNVLGFAILMALFHLVAGVAMGIPVVAMNFRLPNELRGLAMGLQVLLCAFGGAAGSPITAAASGLLGGEMMIGRAMAVVGIPAVLLVALCFWIASRADRAPDAIGPEAPQ